MEEEEEEVEVESIRVSAILLEDLPTDPMGFRGGVEALAALADDGIVVDEGCETRRRDIRKVGIDG